MSQRSFTMNPQTERSYEMGLKSLAEGIIVQSVEDLWDDNLREDCIAFFKGEEFRTCAELADMGLNAQLKLLDMVKAVLENRNGKKSGKSSNNGAGSKAKNYQEWWAKELASCR
jgi:hypothetical protein